MPLRRSLIAACLLLAACAAKEPAPAPAPAGAHAAAAAPPKAEPVDWPGVPNLRRSGRHLFAGQPTEAGLRQAAKRGVRAVINLRKEALPYDEATLAKQLGLRYVRIPIDGRRFTGADVDRFEQALDDDAQGPVLIHCRSGNRVGGLWAVHLVRKYGLDLETALADGRAAGLHAPPTIARTREVAAEPAPAR